MFVVFNKEKIKSYLISAGTVALLFIMGFIITKGETVQTGANQVNIDKNSSITVNETKNNSVENKQKVVNIQ